MSFPFVGPGGPLVGVVVGPVERLAPFAPGEIVDSPSVDVFGFGDGAPVGLWVR
jgi:hypothetical protein